MKKVFAALGILATVSCIAQNTPSTVKEAFAKNFPNTTVKKWDKEDGNYEANFTKDGKTMSATFAANGALKETETGIKTSELPSSVVDYIKASYKGATIKEAALIVRGRDKIYEAEVKGKDLLFDLNGKFIKAEAD